MSMKNTLKFLATGVLASLASHTIAQNKNKMESSELKTATFGAGCFWCTEAVFLNVNGVTKVVSGYSGGKVKKPTYTAKQFSITMNNERKLLINTKSN